MKSRRVKAVARTKEFLSKKKLRGNIPLDASDSGSDIDSDSFFHDEIDDYYEKQDDELSTDDELIQHKNESSEEEEVLPITDAEDGGDEKTDDEDWGDEDSDDEDSGDEDLPNPEAWGKRKSTYYDADFVDEDRGRTYREEDEEAAKAEADEAMSIHKSVYSNISADNLGANLFLESSESLSEYEYEDERENLALATKHEKIKCLKKTNPEMFSFFSDYKTSIAEIRDKLLPLLSLALERKLPTEACAEYIKVKYQLLMHLSLNINYYMMLKSNGTSTHNHPVVQRISSLKKFLEQMKPIDDAVDEDVKIFVENVEKKKMAAALNSSAQDKLSESDSISERESEPLLAEEKEVQKQVSKRKNIERKVKGYFDEVKESIKKRKIELADDIQGEPLDILLKDENLRRLENENPLDEKRTITYQIAKNKGLVARRKKEHRNPRVKHRNKFRKANIRRKGQVREVVKEITRYEGEPTGISTHVVKSIKLK